MEHSTISKLSDPITYDGDSIEEKIRNGFDYFYNIFLKKDIKPTFNGKYIFFDMDQMLEHRIKLPYPKSFMHIISLDNDDKYSMFPCTNDISMEFCENQCTLHNALARFQFYLRWECAYRLSRIHWIPEIIKLYEEKDSNIYYFEEDATDGKKRFKNIYLRYDCGVDDYLIFMHYRPKSDDYLFITAFPVVYTRKKEELNIKFKK